MANRLTDEVAVLAATRAALDTTRAEWHSDILVSTIIEILDRKGQSSMASLRTYLKESWVGRSTPVPVMRDAIDIAQREHLIEERKTGRGKTVWAVTPAVAEEARQDRDWAKSIIATFQTDIRARLVVEFGDEHPAVAKAEPIARSLINVMMKATRSVFEAVKGSSSAGDLSNVELNLRTFLPTLKQSIQPREVADFVANMAMECARPGSDFGDQILRSIIAGQVLHGMVTRADVDSPPPATTLVLDTSELLSLLRPDTGLTPVTRHVLELALSLGCRIVVTTRVVEEWDEQWEMADKDEEISRRKLKGNYVSGLQMHASPILSAFGHAAEEAGTTYHHWARDRRSLHKLLAPFEAEFVDPVDIDFDETLSIKIADSLAETNQDFARPRKPRACENDGISAAIVARIRSETSDALAPAAWFVAHDIRIQIAYEACCDDPFPISTNARTWLLFYSSFDAENSSARAELAELVADDLMLESFLSVSSAFTQEELIELSDSLAEGEELSKEDVSNLLIDTFNLADGQPQRGLHVGRARTRRRNQRILRRDQEQREAVTEGAGTLRSKEVRIKDLESDVADTNTENEKLRRTIQVVVIGFLATLVLVVCTVLRVADFGWLVFAWLLLGIFAVADAPKYVTSVNRSRWILAGELVGSALLVIVGAIVS